MRKNINKPRGAEDFEELCKHVYSTVYKDPTPKNYGRKGQAQYGKDILIQKNNNQTAENRIAIQCKHVQKLSFDNTSGDSVINEINKAEKQIPPLNINHLIIATSLSADRTLTDQVIALSDTRFREQKFTVSIEYWSDIEDHIYKDDKLLTRYQDDSQLPEIFLKKIANLLNTQEYKILENEFQLIDPFIGNFNFKEKAKYYFYKCLSDVAKWNLYEALINIIEANKLDPQDDYLCYEIYLTLNHDLEEGKVLLDNSIKNGNSSTKIILNEYYLKHLAGEELPPFNSLKSTLQAQSLLQQIYLHHYLRQHNPTGFFDIYNNHLSENDKQSVLIKADYLNMLNLQGFKSLINEEIRKLDDRQLISWYLSQPNIERYLGIVLIHSYLILEDKSKAIALFKDLEKNQPSAIDEQCLYLMFGAVEKNDTELYQQLITLYLSLIQCKTPSIALDLLPVISHFNDINTLESLEKKFDEPERIVIEAYKKNITSRETSYLAQELSKAFKNSNLYSFIHLLKLALDTDQFDSNLQEDLISQFEELVLQKDYTEISKYKNIIFEICIVSKNIHLLYNILIKNQPFQYSYDYSMMIESCLTLKLYNLALKYIEELQAKSPTEKEILQFNLQLATQILDYDLMEELTKGIDIKEKNSYIWFIELIASKKILSTRKFKEKISNLPPNIEGDIRNSFQLVAIEITESYEKQALDRATSILKKNITNEYAQEQFFHLITPLDLKRYIPTKIYPGCEVIYQDPNGNDHSFFVETEQSLQAYFPTDPELSRTLMNKKVGDSFSIPNNFMSPINYIVKELKSPYHVLYKYVTKNIDNPMTPLSRKFVQSTLPELDNIQPDDARAIIQKFLDPFITSNRDMQKNAEYILDRYFRTELIPLGFTAKLLRKTKLDLVSLFEHISPKVPLRATLKNASTVNLNTEKTLVIDSITLYIFAKLNSLDLLNPYQVHITTHTESELLAWKKQIDQDIESNTYLFWDKENLPFISKKDQPIYLEIQKHLNNAIAFIEDISSISPSYGCFNDQDFTKFYMFFSKELAPTLSILDDEALSILRLLDEKENAVLLSIDANFLNIAQHLFSIECIDILGFYTRIYTGSTSEILSKKIMLFTSKMHVELKITEGIEYILRGKKEFREFISFLIKYYRDMSNRYTSRQIQDEFYIALITIYEQEPLVANALCYLIFSKDATDPNSEHIREMLLEQSIQNIDIRNFSILYANRIPKLILINDTESVKPSLDPAE